MALHGFNRRLRWSDFSKVKESLDGEHDANTSTEVNCSVRYVTYPNGTWKVSRVSVVLSFVHAKSWVVTGRESAALLKHEQMHYDIAAIGARELERRLSALKGDASSSPDEASKSVMAEILGEDASGGDTGGLLRDVQDRYDSDPSCGSNHGVAKHHQITWEHRIIQAHGSSSGTLEQLNSCPRPRAAAAASGE